MNEPYDALLVVSFGGPERPDEVMPFLERVCRGKDVPRERIEAAARRYEVFGGASPLGAAVRALLAAVVDELNRRGPRLPVYWGNRNAPPLLPDTLRQMADDGVRRALAFVTSALGSYPGCRQYQEDLAAARVEVGAGAPRVDKLRLFYNHPGFIEAMADRIAAAFGRLNEVDCPQGRLVFTAHSLPVAMAAASPYVDQLRESCRLVAERLHRAQWDLAYQSRSGWPGEPWLEPDVGDLLCQMRERGERAPVVIAPIGFIVEHMETAYDLDVELAALAEQLEIPMVRAATVGNHPRFVAMIRELIEERMSEHPDRAALGAHGPPPDVCPPGCCRPRGGNA
ncbi:MAG: ferrochelatase [Pirellulales bacterium]|nr:ferrochelatase [Pirellulales bacterium]